MKVKEKPAKKSFKISKVKKIGKKTSMKSKSKISKPKKKTDLSSMSVDEFLSSGFQDIDNDSDTSKTAVNVLQSQTKINEKKKKTEKKSNANFSKELGTGKKGLKEKHVEKKLKKKSTIKKKEPDDSDTDEENENSEQEEDAFKKHKRELDGLKTTDPEFYNYLKEHDEDLLNFSESEPDEEEVEKCHTAPESLEVASDESDFEPEEGGLPLKRDERAITMAMISSWQERLRTTKNKKVLRDVIDAFHAAFVRVASEDDGLFRFKVEGSSIFNAIIRMCVMDFHSGLRSFLKLEENSHAPATKSKYWPKIKSLLKSYFEDLMRLCEITSPNMLRVLLKHIHQMIPFLIYFPNLSLRALKILIGLWSKSEEVVRVLSFLCILRFTNRNNSFLTPVLKKMYMSYVRNTQFVSPNTLPEINFMRQSLSEMFALDGAVSYQLAFVYIRQLAVHLRYTVQHHPKDVTKTVYTWQFISSLQLWSEVFGKVTSDSPLRSLVYPLIQIIIATINLKPSPEFYPLRFHCCRVLINISHKCGVFIPLTPYILEVLQEYDFNKEHKKLSMKPLDFTFVLRCSELEMKENGFKDALIDNINNLLVEYVASESHRISFPDVFLTCILQLKQFIKNCKIVSYTKLMKALLEKINENAKFIESERKDLNIKLADINAVEAIETGIKSRGTPFLTYYQGWKKVYLQSQARKVVDNVKIGDYKLPTINKLDKKSATERSSPGPPVLFPSDDEASELSFGLREESNTNEGREKKKRKVKNKEESPTGKPRKDAKRVRRDLAAKNGAGKDETDDEEDIVCDINVSDDE